ncbi:MAG: hypothetical protein KAW92_10560 [Candidatus Cloacimonetes bacterium]|nr:hypothetical protein [Candidatus Cloacimonadota bacterium]
MTLKKGSKIENIHTQQHRRIVAVEHITIKQHPLTREVIYVLDDGDRRNIELLNKHWREVK